MRSFFRCWLYACLFIMPSLCTSYYAIADEEEEAPKEPTLITLGEGKIQLEAPAEWESKKPQNRIVDFEFAIPPAEGDEHPGRVTVMGAGGGVEGNIKRWIDQFEQPDGSDTKDKTDVDKKEINETEVHVVSITGTYKDTPGGPFAKKPPVLRENYRMLSAIIVTKESGHYFIKLYGPQKTVDAQEEAFQKMLETLKVTAE